MYYNNDTLGRLFEQGGAGPTSLAAIEDVAGTVFCADGGDADGSTTTNNTQIVQTSSLIVVRPDNNPPIIQSSQGDLIARHNAGSNATFFDGHAKWFKITELGKRNVAGNYPYFTKIVD